MNSESLATMAKKEQPGNVWTGHELQPECRTEKE